MKNPVVKNGILAGIINALFLLTFGIYGANHTIVGAEIFGFLAMTLSFIYVFVGVNQKRKLNQTDWGFSKAFFAGIIIVFIASLFYVFTWLFVYYNFIPDFMDRYAEVSLNKLKTTGISEAELTKKIAEFEAYKINYKNPVYNAGITFSEIFPFGFFVALIAAAVYRKKLYHLKDKKD